MIIADACETQADFKLIPVLDARHRRSWIRYLGLFHAMADRKWSLDVLNAVWPFFLKQKRATI